MGTSYRPQRRVNGLATALEYIPHFAVQDVSEPRFFKILGDLISKLTLHDDQRYSWQPRDRDTLAKSVASQLATNDLLNEEASKASLLAWAVILRDSKLLSAYLDMCTASVSVTVLSVGGNLIYGPASIPCRDPVKNLKAAIRDKALHEKMEIAGSRFRLLIQSCSKRVSDEIMLKELEDDDACFRFAPGDVTLTLVVVAP